MNAETELAKVIADAIEKKMESARSESTTMPGEYMGKDAEGKAWALLPGAESPTPVSRMAVEAEIGDIVSVTVGNGRAVIDSNISNPSAGIAGVKKVDQKAEVAKETASQAIDYASAASAAAIAAKSSAETAFKKSEEAAQEAVNAKASADVANSAAIEATGYAVEAHEQALIALGEAQTAHDAANDAQASADAAQTSAHDALVSANTAYVGLSEVERVVGTVNWIAEHGTYVSAEGTELDESRVYYRRIAIDFALTQDESIVSGKEYYTRSGDGTDEDPYTYTLVDEPDVSEIATYYEAVQWRYDKVDEPTAEEIDEYYLLSIDESVENYISTHLALTDEGLRVFGTADDYSVVLSPDGMDVRNASGVSVAAYGETTRIGLADNVHLLAQATRISFASDAGDVAYIGMGEDDAWRLFIDQADVEDSIRFGNYAWVHRPNGNMALKYIGGDE